MNKKLKESNDNNAELLKNLENKLEKVNKEISNILNAIMNGIVNNMIKEKLDELEQVKLNLDLKMSELKIENKEIDTVGITEDQIRVMFSQFSQFIKERNIPECKKFIGDYIKEVIIYKDYIEVIFNVVFSFVDDEITHDFYITIEREKIK